jgi:hypothetical protein
MMTALTARTVGGKYTIHLYRLKKDCGCKKIPILPSSAILPDKWTNDLLLVEFAINTTTAEAVITADTFQTGAVYSGCITAITTAITSAQTADIKRGCVQQNHDLPLNKCDFPAHPRPISA